MLMYKLFLIIFSAALIIIGGFLSVSFFSQNDIEKKNEPIFDIQAQVSNLTQVVSATITSDRKLPVGYREYVNEHFQFSLRIPDALQVREYKEGAGALTIVFETPEGLEGFQIFIVPYRETKITDERFLKDAPSSIMREPVNILIDGIPASAFFGEHLLLGETREVWFIKDGHLFEITTYRELDEWFMRILQTWTFI